MGKVLAEVSLSLDGPELPRLEPTQVLGSPLATHLRYRVVE
jgi:hypothetical protein